MFKSINPEKEYKHTDIWNYVYERDNGNCQLCGKNNGCEQHHVMPLGNGGKTKPGNLILLCTMCHTGLGHSFTQEMTQYMYNRINKNESKFRKMMI